MSIEDKETLIEYVKSALSTLAILVVPVLALWASFA
jgi:fumarate reductase subunit D